MSFSETICYFDFRVKNLNDDEESPPKGGNGEWERAFCKKLSIYKRLGEGEKNVEHRTSNVESRIGKPLDVEHSALEVRYSSTL
jgi:hypothetical protein